MGTTGTVERRAWKHFATAMMALLLLFYYIIHPRAWKRIEMGFRSNSTKAERSVKSEERLEGIHSPGDMRRRVHDTRQLRPSQRQVHRACVLLCLHHQPVLTPSRSITVSHR